MAVFLNDTLTDSNNTLLENHTPETGGSWTKRSGSPYLWIQSNKVRATSSQAALYTNGATPGSAEYDFSAKLKADNSSYRLYLIARFIDTSNYYYAYWAAGILRLYKMVAGVATQLDSQAKTPTLGQEYDVKFEIRDATKKVYVDTVEQLSSVDNALTAAGVVGIQTDDDGTFDDLVADDVAGGPAIVEGSASLTGAGALAAVALARSLGTATLAGTGSIAASALAVAFGTAPLTGSGALSGAGVRVVRGAGALAGGGSLAADGLVLVLAASAMVGAGAINADALAIVPASVAMSGAGGLSAAGVRSVNGAAALSGAGILDASALRLVLSEATITGGGSLVADAKAIVLASAVMPGAGALSGAAFAIVPATAALVGGGACGLTAPVVVIFGVATLAGTGGLTADGDVAVLATVLGAARLIASGGLRASGMSYRAPGTWGTWYQRATLWEMSHHNSPAPSGYVKDPDGTTPWDLP